MFPAHSRQGRLPNHQQTNLYICLLSGGRSRLLCKILREEFYTIPVFAIYQGHNLNRMLQMPNKPWLGYFIKC